MTSHRAQRTAEELRRQHANESVRESGRQEHRRRTLHRIGWGAGVTLVVGAIAFGLLTSQPAQTDGTRVAPDFTLTSTSGEEVTLSDYRGQNVVLYFSEGAGCQSCLVQMAEIEKDKVAFAAAGVTILPIVMNSVEQITADMQSSGVTTPFLLDDGTVSTAYGTIGKGMHGGLPGHSFVLIDKEGTQRWYGEYPSMWLDPTELLTQVTDRLSS